MSAGTSTRTQRSGLHAGGGSSWASAAFIVESVVLLLFLAASLAVLTSVFAQSLKGSVESARLDAAVIEATNAAERFAADPAHAEPVVQSGGFVVTCDVTGEKRAGGTLYRAEVKVFAADGGAEGEGAGAEAEGDPAAADAATTADPAEPVYALSTARYVPDAQGGAR